MFETNILKSCNKMCRWTMQADKKLLTDLIKKQKDCEFSLKFFLQSKNGDWKNIFAMLELVKKGTRSELDHTYGEFVLGERLLDVEEGLKVISNLYEENDEKRRLEIPGYAEFTVRVSSRSQFVASKQRWGLLRRNWPMRYYTFEVYQDKKGTSDGKELLKGGLPYYPSAGDATVSFFELAVEHFSSYGEVYLVIIDYRARIESLKLAFSRAELRVDSPEIEYSDLLVKVFAKSGLEILTLPDINPTSELVKFEVGFQPDNLSVALLSRQDDIKIDGKEFAKWREEGEGVLTERPEEEILSLLRAGESQNLEYKQHLDDENKKNDFIETVVAFLNTNRGIILVGVQDEGNVVGSQKSAKDIQNLIHDSCDPPPKDIKIQEKKISGNRVILVDVPKGDDKPYQSKRDKNFYIRHNASDMRMERSELVSLLEEKNKQMRQPSF